MLWRRGSNRARLLARCARLLNRCLEITCFYRVLNVSMMLRRIESPLAALLLTAIAVLQVGLSGCAGRQSDSSGSQIEGPSNEESPQEAAEVQAVIKSARPQAFPQQLDGCWKATVARPDVFSRQLQAPPDSILTLDCCTPVDYALCFNRASGVVSFSASGLGFRLVSQWFGTTVVPMDNHSDLLFSTENDFAVLRSVGHYEVRCGLITAKVSSRTDLRATSLGSNKIFVEGSTKDVCSGSRVLNCDGQPWAESTWRAELTRQLDSETTVGGRQ